MNLLLERNSPMEAIFETWRDPCLVLDSNLIVKKANPSFCKWFGFSKEEVEDTLFWGIRDGQFDHPFFHLLMGISKPLKGTESFVVKRSVPGAGTRIFSPSVRGLSSKENELIF